MTDNITMRCPDCDKTVQSPRDPTDYPETHTIVVQCDECDDGDFHEAFHLDADGKHITRDPMEPAHPAQAGGES